MGLPDLVARAVDPWARCFTCNGPAVWLSPRQALSISLALHELATNAAKYGALSTPAGRVLIGWRVTDHQLHLRWREHGGPEVHAPVRRGFGSRLLEQSIGGELQAQGVLTFEPEGVEFRLTLPLNSELDTDV